MRRAIAPILIAALNGSPSAAAEPLQPTGPWHVDYDTAQCLAIRDYGTVEKPLELMLKPSPNGGVMRILVIRKGTTSVYQSPVTVQLGRARLRTSILHYADEKHHFRIASLNVPMSDFKGNLDATIIGMHGSADETFAVSQLKPLTDELDKCLVDLQSFWNVGPAYADRVASDAKPMRPLRQLFSPGDYPGIAMLEGQSGAVKIVFLIDEHGAISDCSVDRTSEVASLDAMSCYVLQSRAKFAPALGKDGKPVRSGYCQRIIWRVAPGASVPMDDRDEPHCPEKEKDRKR